MRSQLLVARKNMPSFARLCVSSLARTAVSSRHPLRTPKIDVPWAVVFPTLLILVIAPWYLSNEADSHKQTRLEAAVTQEECSTFRLFAALDAKEERDKLRLAQILHDLHNLAKDEKKNLGGIRKHVTIAMNDDSSTKISGPQIGDLISLASLDLFNLSKQDAHEILQGLEVGSRLDVASLTNLLVCSTKRLKQEPNLLDVSKRREIVTVVGDLHGSLESLTHILQNINFDERIVVFDGDFVDRGESSLEVLASLLVLKMAHPDNVFLIRGNHEDSMVASVYGFRDEIRKKYGDADAPKIWKLVGQTFAALPLALRTKTALILHGGLPSPDFDLRQLESLPKEKRFKCETIVNPVTLEEKFLAGIVWSDPTDGDENAVEFNPRGVGILFGSRIAENFLERSNLQFLVRGHEVVQSGMRDMKCGKDKSVITVFSAAAYPANTGTNRGAILHLNPDGSHVHESYTYSDISVTNEKLQQQITDQALAKVRYIIGCNLSKLEKAFSKVQTAGRVTREQWAQVMSETVDSCGVPWIALQPKLAPVGCFTGTIPVQEFLRNHALRLHDNNTQNNDADLEVLAENQEMLLTVFKFLDTDGDGTLSLMEFSTGVKLLNKRLPPERQLASADEMFKLLDTDGNGSISFQEFTDGFKP